MIKFFKLCYITGIGLNTLCAQDLQFVYLDSIDPSIIFSPIMNSNRMMVQEETKDLGLTQIEYSIFSTNCPFSSPVPGYEGNRCIIELKMALKLKEIQKELKENSPYQLKIFDTYRPQQAVDFLGEWILRPEDPVVKKFHHPSVNKSEFHQLNYIAKKSSHSLGTAVDLTLVMSDKSSNSNIPVRPQDFIGIYDPIEVDMGNVGYLAFDPRSSHIDTELTSEQINTRLFLLNLMKKHDFEILRSEFWHYFYKRDRNRNTYFNFPIRDDYNITEDGIIIIG